LLVGAWIARTEGIDGSGILDQQANKIVRRAVESHEGIDALRQ
jgi:hypothetical protein